MVTAQELEQQEAQARALASQTIPRRRFGTQVTAQTQQQVLRQRQQGQQQLQEVQQERQRQAQLNSQTQQAQQDYNDYLFARKIASRNVPIPYAYLTKRQREIVSEIRAGIDANQKYKDALAKAKFSESVYASQEASGQPFTPAYYTPYNPATYRAPYQQYQTYRDAPISYTPKEIERREQEQQVNQETIARQQKGDYTLRERYELANQFLVTRVTKPLGKRIYQYTGLTPEKTGQVLSYTNPITLPLSLSSRKAQEFQAGFSQGIIEDIRDQPLKNVILYGAGYGVSYAFKGAGAIITGFKLPIAPAVEKLAVLGGVGVTGFYLYKTGTQVYSTQSYREAGKITGVEVKNLVLIGAGAKAGQRSFEKISDYARTFGLKEIPSENIIAREYFTGQTYPAIRRGQTAGQLKQEFYKPIEFVDEVTNIKSSTFTASPQSFTQEITIGKGSSELFGLYTSPRLSPKFLGTGGQGSSYNLFSFKGALEYSRPTALRTNIPVELIPQLKPGQSNILKLNDEIKRLFGGGYKRDFGKPILQRGKAYIPFVKSEKEAIIPFDTVLKLVQKKFFFKFNGRRVPILQATVTSIDSKGVKEILSAKKFSTRYGSRPSSLLNPFNIQISSYLNKKETSNIYYSNSSTRSYLRSLSNYSRPSLSRSSISYPSVSPPRSPPLSPPSSPPRSPPSRPPRSPPSRPPRYYPPYIPPRIPPIRPPKYPKSRIGKVRGDFATGFRTFIKSQGKKVYLKGIDTKGIALEKGIRATTRGRTSLSATFGIERAGTVFGNNDNIDRVSKNLFREFKIVRGKRIKTPDTFIQRRGKRLSTIDERRRIQEARRSSVRRR